MPYLTNAQFLMSYDARSTGDLVNDAGIRATPNQLLNDPVLNEMISQASGGINQAALIGGRYTVAQLQALTGDDAAILRRYTAKLAFVYLCNRRGIYPKEFTRAEEESNKFLDQLRLGTLIFNVAGDVADGNATINFPSMAAYRGINQLRDACSRAFVTRRIQQVESN